MSEEKTPRLEVFESKFKEKPRLALSESVIVALDETLNRKKKRSIQLSIFDKLDYQAELEKTDPKAADSYDVVPMGYLDLKLYNVKDHHSSLPFRRDIIFDWTLKIVDQIQMMVQFYNETAKRQSQGKTTKTTRLLQNYSVESTKHYETPALATQQNPRARKYITPEGEWTSEKIKSEMVNENHMAYSLQWIADPLLRRVIRDRFFRNVLPILVRMGREINLETATRLIEHFKIRVPECFHEFWARHPENLTDGMRLSQLPLALMCHLQSLSQSVHKPSSTTTTTTLIETTDSKKKDSPIIGNSFLAQFTIGGLVITVKILNNTYVCFEPKHGYDALIRLMKPSQCETRNLVYELIHTLGAYRPPEAVPEEGQTCFGCGACSEVHCTRCSIASYCSQECQVKDWKENRHKSVCMALSAYKDALNNGTLFLSFVLFLCVLLICNVYD